MEYDAIVVAAGGKLGEVLAGLGGVVMVEFDSDISLGIVSREMGFSGEYNIILPLR